MFVEAPSIHSINTSPLLASKLYEWNFPSFTGVSQWNCLAIWPQNFSGFSIDLKHRIHIHYTAFMLRIYVQCKYYSFGRTQTSLYCLVGSCKFTADLGPTVVRDILIRNTWVYWGWVKICRRSKHLTEHPYSFRKRWQTWRSDFTLHDSSTPLRTSPTINLQVFWVNTVNEKVDYIRQCTTKVVEIYNYSVLEGYFTAGCWFWRHWGSRSDQYICMCTASPIRSMIHRWFAKANFS